MTDYIPPRCLHGVRNPFRFTISEVPARAPFQADFIGADAKLEAETGRLVLLELNGIYSGTQVYRDLHPRFPDEANLKGVFYRHLAAEAPTLWLSPWSEDCHLLTTKLVHTRDNLQVDDLTAAGGRDIPYTDYFRANVHGTQIPAALIDPVLEGRASFCAALTELPGLLARWGFIPEREAARLSDHRLTQLRDELAALRYSPGEALGALPAELPHPDAYTIGPLLDRLPTSPLHADVARIFGRLLADKARAHRVLEATVPLHYPDGMVVEARDAGSDALRELSAAGDAVLKPLHESGGHGFGLVPRGGLPGLVAALAPESRHSVSAEVLPEHEVASYRAGRYGHQWLVQRRIRNEPLTLSNGRRYDPTMRLNFALLRRGADVRLHLLDSYWKVPLAEVDGAPRLATLSNVHSGEKAVLVDEDSFARSRDQLVEIVPALYAAILEEALARFDPVIGAG